MLHGPYGEDGTIQGLFELANVPYVGAGVMASAVGMDKSIMKVLFGARGLPTPAFETVGRGDWMANRAAVLGRLTRRFGFPVFVKPANLGSSVGISRARNEADLAASLDLAAEFDRKVLVEAAVPNAREIEVAVLGNDTPEASVPGEIIPAEGCAFYDYEPSTRRTPACSSRRRSGPTRRRRCGASPSRRTGRLTRPAWGAWTSFTIARRARGT